MSKETIPSNSGQLGAEVIDFEEARLNVEFAKLNPMQRIARAHELFGDGLILATSFGPTSPFLLQVACSIAPDIPVVNIRHGYETKHTQEFAQWYIDTFGLNIHIYQAEKRPIPPEHTEAFNRFQREIKVDQFQKAKDDLEAKAYLSGRMYWQTEQRKTIPFVERKGSIFAINPLLDMTEEDVEDYLEVSGLPKNTDYFDPTKGESQKKECQLNTSFYR